MSQTTDSASLDAMLDMLSNTHRRRILLAVADHNPRDEDELTQDGITPDGTVDERLEQLKIALQHTHLPKLAERGYINWGPDTRTIRRGPNFDDIAPLLELVDNHADELPDDWP